MCKISDISISINSGLTPLKSNDEYWNSNDIPWLKTEQLGQYKIYDTNEFISKKAFDDTSLKLYPVNTISVAMYGEGKTRGNVSILMNEMTTNQACCNIIVDEEKANYLYVYYWLKNSYLKLRALAAGVRKNLNSEDIKNFEIDIKDRETQDDIASVLSAIDDKISTNNHINAELESMAKTIYDYWFLQFEFPDENGKPYKSSGGKMVWNEELKRDIPEGWTSQQLSSIIDVSNSRISSKDIGDKAYVPIEVIPRNKMSFYETADIEKASTGLCPFTSKSILLSNRRVYFHKVSISPFDGITRDTVIIINPKNENNLGYVFQQVNSKHFIEYATRNSYGTEQPVLATPTVQKYLILKPKNNLDSLYSKKIQPMIDKVLSLQLENQQLASLRDFLLPLLMNGQVGFKGD